MMFWPGSGVTGWGWVLMTMSMVLFWGLIALGGYLLVRGVERRSTGAPPDGRPSPEEVLADRFARGEIDEEEYRRRLATLLSRHAPAP